MKTLETKRLILRDWQESDLNDLYEYAKVDGVGEMAGWKAHENIEVSKRILKDFIDKGDVYAAVLKENGKVIGSLGIHDRTMDKNYKADVQREIGYVLSKDYWGKGIMPEAVREAIKYAFEEIKTDVLWCGHFTINPQSQRVVEKSGFKFYGNGKYEAKALNKTFDEKQYIMTKEDYETLYGK
jgi:ribosomal-protein-alanine N-acetyltransferase